MYDQFFGLSERPFDLVPNPRYLVLTESHREALSNLEYGIASKKGLTLLIGDAGSGKTTIVRTAIQRQPLRVHTVHLHNPTLSGAEFSQMLACKFGLSEQATRSKTSMLIELEALLRHRRSQGEVTVIVIDEAQSLPFELLEEIRLLANIETDDEKLLPVVLAGQPELAARLNEPQFRQLKQRVALRCELRPLTSAETAEFIAVRLKLAGAKVNLFTAEAVALIDARSGGLPRLINVLADNALLGGFAAGRNPVGADIVNDVCRDFDLLEDRRSVRGPTVAPSAFPGRQATFATVLRPDESKVTHPDDVPEVTAADDSEPATVFAGATNRRRRFFFK